MRHWAGLVQQLEVAMRMGSGIARIHEQTTVHERSVDVAHHGTDISQRIRLAGLIVARLERFYVGLEIVVPPFRIGFIT